MARLNEIIFENTVKTKVARVYAVPAAYSRRIITLNHYEAQQMLNAGKTVFEKTVESETGRRHFYYIEIDFQSLIEIAE